jgi:hypothetical protein
MHTRRGRGRPAHSAPTPTPTPVVGRVTKERFEPQSRRRASIGDPPHARPCGDLAHLQSHIDSAQIAMKHPKVCQVCGEQACSKCGLCDVALQNFPRTGTHTGAECFLQHHDMTP